MVLAHGALEFRAQRVDGKVAAVGLDVDEIDVRAAVAGAVGRGDEGVGGGPERPPRTEAEGEGGQVQAGGGAADRHGVPGAADFRDPAFELLDGGALGQEIRAQHRGDGRDILLADVLSRVRKHGRKSGNAETGKEGTIRAAGAGWRSLSSGFRLPGFGFRVPRCVRLRAPVSLQVFSSSRSCGAVSQRVFLSELYSKTFGHRAPLLVEEVVVVVRGQGEEDRGLDHVSGRRTRR